MARMKYLGGEDPSSHHKTRVRRKRDDELDQFDGIGRRTGRFRDLNANLYDKGESKELPGIERDPERFRQNIGALVGRYRIPLKELAAKADVEYRWLRRIVRVGLERRVGRLDRLARTLGLPDGDYFWAPDIDRFLPPPPPHSEELASLKQRLNWPYARRLLDLLETGDHEFLKGLLDTLYGASCSVASREFCSSADNTAKQIGSAAPPSPPTSESVGGAKGEPPLARRARRKAT